MNRIWQRMTPVSKISVLSALAMLSLAIGACTPAAFFNMTSTLGGTSPGSRGNVQILFINETPYRAIFTFGTYDPQNLDQDGEFDFPPEVGQFFISDDATERLEGNTSSQVFTFTCGRATSIGGEQLLHLLRDEDLDGELETSALTAGVAFSDQPLDSDTADQATAGRGRETLTLQGAEYQCDSLLTYTFSIDTSREACLGDTPLPDDCFLTDLTVLLP